MKRKLTFGTIILTAFLLCGCTTGNAQGGGSSSDAAGSQSTNASGSSAGMENSQNAGQTQESTQMQGDSQSQGSDQMQDNSQSQGNDQMQGNTSSGDTTQNNTSQNNQSQETMMTEEEAKNLALSFIEITNDDVTFIKCDLEDDNGRAYYDVEFYTLDQNDYDFEIDPYTGEIIEWDVEPIYDVNS